MFVSGRIKGETCRLFVEYMWILMSRKRIPDRISLWKRNLKSSKLIKPQFADWRGSIKIYLYWVESGHFIRQLG